MPRRSSESERPALEPLLERSPASKSSILFYTCPYILGQEFCERLAFYGLATNLVIYLQTVMGESASSAAVQCMLFEGSCYLSPILGAVLADSRWGRYKTILVFSGIYLLGLACLAASACIPGLTPGPGQATASWPQNLVLFSSLYIVALGTGGIKPNVSAFGADQFDLTNEQDVREKKSFFNAFYAAINLGSLLACTVVVYVQEYYSWAVGFAIPAVAMALAICVFVSGNTRYKHVKPSESPLSRVVKVLWAASKRKRKPKPPAGAQAAQDQAWADAQGDGSIAAALHKTHSYQWLDSAVEGDASERAEQPGGLAGFSAEQVEEVRMVVRMLPVFFTTILYWSIYAQMGSFFVEQGEVMDRRIKRGLQIPAASLAIFNTLSIVVLIPLYDQVLVPLLARCGVSISHLARIGWGQLVCVVAMLTAAWLEYRRLAEFRQGHVLPHHQQHAGLGARPKAIVDLSVFWQTPQYLLIGLSEILASIGQMEFFYDQSPDVMRSCCMALQLLSVAIGSYLSGALVWGVSVLTASLGWNHGLGWLPAQLNFGRLDLFFCSLAGLSAVNLVLFLWVASRYTYKTVVRRSTSTAGPLQPGSSAQQRRPHPSYLRPHTVSGPSREVPINAGPRPEEDVGLYGTPLYSRSVTFRAESPAMPAAFR